MKTWQVALLGVALLATAGCRSNQAIPLLERQLRLQEDEIYRLRAQLEDLQDGGSSCPHRPDGAARSDRDRGLRPRRGRAAPSLGLGGPQRRVGTEIGHRNPRPALRKSARHAETPRPAGHLRDPRIGRPIARRPPDRVSARTMARQTRMSGPSRAGEPVPFSPEGDSRHVASIAIDRTLTGGINSGDRAGDQGLLVVVEPRDRAGRSVDAPAAMSVVALDPAILDSRGKAVRVGRWDFTAAETAGLFRRTDSSRAVHLAMAWPADPPKHGKLHLFVRYVTADGRRLEADSPIEVALAGERQAGWQSAPPSRRDADDGEYSGGRQRPRTSGRLLATQRVTVATGRGTSARNGHPSRPAPAPAPRLVARAAIAFSDTGQRRTSIPACPRTRKDEGREKGTLLIIGSLVCQNQ